MLKRFCPECGHELVFRHGQYGQFIGCSNYPECTFTMNEDGTPTQRKREIDEWDEYGKPTSYSFAPIIKAKKIRKCPYGACDGSGLLPFTKPDGTISKYAKVFCECHDTYGGNVYPYALEPSDFDYSVSYSVYRSLCHEHGWADPGPDRPSEVEPLEPETQFRVVVHRHDYMKPRDFALLQEHDRQLKYLLGKQTEREKPKAQSKYD